MKLRLALASCLGLLALAGCTKGWQRAQTAASQRLQCPPAQVYVEEVRGKYYAEGCGRHAECSKDGRTCREYLTAEELMVVARRTFAHESGCSEQDIVVMRSAEGTIVDGCGRFALCPDGSQTCFAQNRPTCEQLAQSRYDGCVASARSEGRDGRRERPHWASDKAVVSSAIISGMAEHKGMESCKHIYAQEAARCQPAPPPASAVAAPPAAETPSERSAKKK